MLKELVLCRLGKLRHVTVQEGAVPHLQVSRLQDCKLLVEVPLGVEFLAHLKQLTFVDMGHQPVTKLHSITPNSHLSRVFIGLRDAEGLYTWKQFDKKEGF